MKILNIALLLSLLCFTGCETMDSLTSTGTKVEDGNEPGLGLPPYSGVKHAIGVLPIVDDTNWTGEISLKENMTVMLENALLESGRFIVVDRENLNSTMSEQDLQASTRAAKAESVAQTGKIRSAKYLASVTILGIENEGGGAGGINTGKWTFGASGASTQISIMVKIFDSTSSEMVASQRVVGHAKAKGGLIGFTDNSFSTAMGGQKKTPVAEALYDCTSAAVKYLAGEFEDYKIEGRVVRVLSNGDVIINLGTRQNTTPGMRFEVRELGETITDPVTGEILERIEGTIVSILEINTCREKISYCKIIEGEAPADGDKVVVPPNYTQPDPEPTANETVAPIGV